MTEAEKAKQKAEIDASIALLNYAAAEFAIKASRLECGDWQSIQRLIETSREYLDGMDMLGAAMKLAESAERYAAQLIAYASNLRHACAEATGKGTVLS